MNEAMPLASKTEPHRAAKSDVDSTKEGTAVFTGMVAARNEARYRESIPLNVVKIPLINIMIATKSTPGGFSVCISKLDANFLFMGFIR